MSLANQPTLELLVLALVFAISYRMSGERTIWLWMAIAALALFASSLIH